MLAELLKIHCLTHKATFPMERKSRVVICREGAAAHQLCDDFPHNGNWVYCCNCQNYIAWESRLPGFNPQRCPVCSSRQNVRLFACEHCRVATMDFDEAALRKQFSVLSWGAPQPACPGCRQLPSAATQTHFCETLHAKLTTARPICPFCRQSLTAANPATSQAAIISVPTESTANGHRDRGPAPPPAPADKSLAPPQYVTIAASAGALASSEPLETQPSAAFIELLNFVEASEHKRKRPGTGPLAPPGTSKLEPRMTRELTHEPAPVDVQLIAIAEATARARAEAEARRAAELKAQLEAAARADAEQKLAAVALAQQEAEQARRTAEARAREAEELCVQAEASARQEAELRNRAEAQVKDITAQLDERPAPNSSGNKVLSVAVHSALATILFALLIVLCTFIIRMVSQSP